MGSPHLHGPHKIVALRMGFIKILSPPDAGRNPVGCTEAPKLQGVEDSASSAPTTCAPRKPNSAFMQRKEAPSAATSCQGPSPATHPHSSCFQTPTSQRCKLQWLKSASIQISLSCFQEQAESLQLPFSLPHPTFIFSDV